MVQTWAMTKKMKQKLTTKQRSTEKCTPGITKRDRKTSKWIREQTKIQDIIKQVKIKKWSRSQGQQKTRWRDEIVKFAGMTWMRPAQDISKWYELGEAFALQWADNG